MTTRLTLSQAQERVSAVCPGLAVDWTHPASEARRVALRAADLRLRDGEALAVCEALDAYAAHLAFEAGMAFELAAVKRARADAFAAETSVAGGEALSRFAVVLADGLHHAEPAKVSDVQMGDVWRIGLMVASDAEVRCVHAETGNVTVAALCHDRTHKVIPIAKFTSNRRLVKRDGKAV